MKESFAKVMKQHICLKGRNGRLMPRKKTGRILKGCATGLVTGLANGLFGSGGGTIAVPAMVHFMDLEEDRAHATAIAIILPLTLVSTFFYVRGSYVDWWVTLKAAVGGIGGGYIGARLLPHVPARILRKIFGLFMILAGIRMVF